jgi:CO dehydrogenase maturation factor
MPFQIAVAGKGGTGKTTICALLIRYLIEKGRGPVLAVDADANANLHETLGMPLEHETVSELIAQTKELNGIPAGMSQETYIEYKLNASISEGKEVDLVVMGGPDGPGCYCFPNNLLRKYLDNLAKGYRYLVMDNEAGLEHISRRTTEAVDLLLIISDASARSVRSAGRVNQLTRQIKTKVAQKYLILTKTTAGDRERLAGEIAATGLDLAGLVPSDPLVVAYDTDGKPLFQLPAESAAVQAVYRIFDEIISR